MVVLLMLLGAAQANDCDSWKWVAPLPGVFTVQDMATDGSRVVAVGSGDGLVVTSTDGDEWTFVDSGVDGSLFAVAHNGSHFVAVATDGTAARSTDGLSWTTHDTGAALLRDVVWDGAQWIAIGGADLLTSADGTSWAAGTAPASSNLQSIQFANSQYLATGSNAFVATSPDASTWTTQDTNDGGVGTYEDAAYGAGSWVVIGPSGRLYTSPDGADWTQRSAPLCPQRHPLA